MKNYFLAGAMCCLLLPLAAGCTENAKTTGQAVSAEQADTSYLDDYQPNPQLPDDRELLKKGEVASDRKGESTLHQYRQVEKTVQIGEIQMTIRDFKQLHLRPAYSLIDYFHVLTEDEEFNYVKFFVEIKNESDENLHFAPVALIKSSTGDSWDYEKDVYLDDTTGVYSAGLSKKGNLGYILSTDQDVEWLEITTSDVFNENKEKIVDAETFKISF